jgi:large subunit ribosomal protein L15
MEGFKIKAPKGSTKNKRILGRGIGSARGGTAGRGNKGQNSRSGGGVRPGFEGGQMPLFRRIARRGFSNAMFKEIYSVINIDDLEELYTNNETVTKESLVRKGLVRKSHLLVKLLGTGKLTKKLKIVVDKISASAREKILKAGGEIKIIEQKLKANEKKKAKVKKTTEKKTE